MNQIIAISEDKHWLAAVQKAGKHLLAVQTIPCDCPPIKCLDFLPGVDNNILLLIDAYSKIDVIEIVTMLSQRGWIYIIVVAADPSAREIYKVIHNSGGYDYWTKTYQVPDIQVDIVRCLDEIAKCCLTTGTKQLRGDSSRM